MTGVIYARYSEGPNQTDQSIEGQVADCRAFAEREGIQIIEVYADRKISGTSVEGREEFQRMIYDAQHHRFDCVIVWKIDRFGRNREDIAFNKYKLKKAGVTLKYAAESVPDGPEGIILESVLEGLAEYYSADLRQKVLRGIRESAKKGRYVTSTVPIGYRCDAERHVHVEPVEAEAVREAFRMHIAGATTAEIQKMFSDRGILSQRGNQVSSSLVFRMLRNEKYCGNWELSGVKLNVEPIIDQATFLAAQKNFKTSRNNAAAKANVDYLLSCKCYCGYCGKLMIGEAGTGRHGKVHHYYKCGGRKRGSKCECRPRKKDELEAAVIDATIQTMLTDETIDLLTKRVLEIQEADRAVDPATSYRRQLAQNRKKQRNLIEAIEDGMAKGLSRRLAELEKEEEELKLQIQYLELHTPKLTDEMVRWWLSSFRSGDLSDPKVRRRMIDTFVAKIEIKNDHAVVYYNMAESTFRGSDTNQIVDLTSWYPNHAEPLLIPPFIILWIDL